MINEIIEELRNKSENIHVLNNNEQVGTYAIKLADAIEIVKKHENDGWIKLPEEKKEHRSEYYEFGSVGLSFEIGYNTCLKEIKKMNEFPQPYKGE